MNQGTQGYSLTKKTEGRKSRDSVLLMIGCSASYKSGGTVIAHGIRNFVNNTNTVNLSK
jgi:hypothetical protein